MKHRPPDSGNEIRGTYVPFRSVHFLAATVTWEDEPPATKIEIVTPLIGMRKWEIVKRGAGLGAPIDRTWSCYQFEEEACGVCDACGLRLRAFAAARVRDPIAYRTRVGT